MFDRSPPKGQQFYYKFSCHKNEETKAVPSTTNHTLCLMLTLPPCF